MSAIENGVIQFHHHRDPAGNSIHHIPDVGTAYFYTSGPEAAATLDELDILDKTLQGQGLEPAMLEVAADQLRECPKTQLDSFVSELELALYFREIFGPEGVKVERHNASTMDFEDANLSLDGLILFFQNSPLRSLPTMQHTFRLIAELPATS